MRTEEKQEQKSAVWNVSQQPLWLRNIAYVLNYLFYLKFGAFQYGSIRPILPERDSKKLKTIPSEAGNILVGPHPGNQDAHLLFHIFAKTRTDPVLFLMAAETYFGGTFLRRWMFDRLGVIPVRRGKSSPEIIQQMADGICRGWWGGVYPEGDVYYSREVMPMETGVFRIAVNAALIAQEKRKINNSEKLRPVFITPFAHVYFLRNPNLSRKKLEEAVSELARITGISGDTQCGSFADRLRSISDLLLDEKAREYGIAPDKWQHPDRFSKISRLQNAVLEQIEIRYMGKPQSGFSRRRAMKVRRICLERLEDDSISDRSGKIIEEDIIKVRELILMTPFSQTYRKKYGDLEMWVEYMRRIRTALSMPKKNFGPEDVVFKIMEPIDVHPIAREYQELSGSDEKRKFLVRKTEELRKIIQTGVDEICQQRSTMNVED